MKTTRASVLVAAALPLLAAAPAFAQAFAPLKVPQASPRATVSQTVGVTDLTITYNRPAVNKRKVWGELVPYNDVWRVGANENTTLTITSDVKVNGQPLPAGNYGLHAIPTAGEWTLIFSKEAKAWGSFSYDQKEDALRVKVTPKPAEHQERLAYTFENPTDNGVEVQLRWEKLMVPFTVEVDTPQVVVAALREDLRGLARFAWQGWNQAAAYCARTGVNLDEAMTWADRSVQMNRNFNNLRTKANLVEKKGDTKLAAQLRDESLKVATENDINLLGYNLLGQGKVDDALAMFQKNVKDHPESWNCWDSLAEGYAKKGEKKQALTHYEKALSMVAAEDQKARINKEIAKLK